MHSRGGASGTACGRVGARARRRRSLPSRLEVESGEAADACRREASGAQGTGARRQRSRRADPARAGEHSARAVSLGGWWSTPRVRRRRLRGHATPRGPGAALVLSLPPTVRVFVAVEPVDMRGIVRCARGCRSSSRSRPRRRPSLSLPQPAAAPREIDLVRRLGMVRSREAPRGWQLPAASRRRQRASGLDRRLDVRLVARRHRLHGRTPRLVSAPDRKRSKGNQDDRHGLPSMISTALWTSSSSR